MSILQYFHGSPRPQQEYVLTELEKYWNRYDVFVINSPVAAGKSHIATTLAQWANNSTILTPTNILIDQYQEDFPDLAYLKRKNLYPCGKYNYKCSEFTKHCINCEYRRAKKDFLGASVSVCNYYMYIAMRKNQNYQTKNLIIDEAHNLIPTLTDLASVKLWKSKHKYPHTVRTEEDIMEWIEQNKLTKQKKFKPIVESFYSSEPLYQFEKTTKLYRGAEEELINIKPISVKEYKPIMWPWCINKIVLLSATIGATDVKELGLDRKRVKYIDTNSPIPPLNRPIFYQPIGSLSYKHMNQNISKLTQFIKICMNRFPQKGIVHMTYGMSRKLRAVMDDPRIIWHDQENKKEKYQEYLRRTDAPVLMACGLSEGVDLSDDLGRWQIITKVPYPSLTDSAIKYKADNDPDWYKWLTIKDILQATGRICRNPKDIGYTFIVDSNFKNLYYHNKSMWPDWFNDALIL